MVQGAPKKSASKKSASGKRGPLGPRPGNKVIKPKKIQLIARRKLLKKHSAGLTATTEKNLAEKAGHLEILKGGKKDKKVAERAAAAKKGK